MEEGRRYWFPAKIHGWGWGLPATWEGWLVLGAYLALLIGGAFLFPPSKGLAPYIAYVVILGVLLLAVCWIKGEPPRWR